MPHLLESERPNSRMLRALGLRQDDVRAYADSYSNGDLSTATEALITVLTTMDDPSQVGHKIKLFMHEQCVTRRQAAALVFSSHFGSPNQTE